MKFFLLFSIFLTLISCSTPPKEVSFSENTITESADLWWAKCLSDVNGDGLTDLVVQNANGFGGWLGWLEASTDSTQLWKVHIISDSLGTGQKFAAGDLEVADFDGDGDTDVFGVIHPGEWANADAGGEMYWFENPTWTPHYIGEVKNALKDVSLKDFNGDKQIDVAVISFATNNFRLYEQVTGGTFSRKEDRTIPNLHEGMDAADIDGDGDLDIATNGYFLENTGNAWNLSEIDSIWHNQSGDWSRNATKVAAKDLDGDGRAEVFIAHSERSGYPLAKYNLNEDGTWKKEILLDSISSAHNMQIEDIDLDGRLDIVTGVNFGRAVNLGVKEYPLYVIYNKKEGFVPKTIDLKGTYNILVGDLEGDGDMDLFRYPSHDSKLFHVLVNQLKP